MRSLHGKRVVVTRAEADTSALAGLLADRGAIPVVVPLITTVDEAEGIARLAQLDLGGYEWIVVSSPRGAERLAALHPTPSTRVAAVGRTTGAALARCDFVPEVQSAAGLVAELPAGSGRVLVVQAATAAPTMADGLAGLGYDVTVVAPYRAVTVVPGPPLRAAAVGADAVLFASGSAVQAWIEAIGPTTPPVVVAIGPQTARVAQRAGLAVTAVASEHSLSGMVDVLADALAGST